MYQTFGFSSYESMLWGLPRLAVYVIVFILVALYTQKFQNQRLYIMILCCLLPFVGMLVMSLLPNIPEYKWIKWAMFMLTVVFSLSIFLAWSLSKSTRKHHLCFTPSPFASCLCLRSGPNIPTQCPPTSSARPNTLSPPPPR